MGLFDNVEFPKGSDRKRVKDSLGEHVFLISEVTTFKAFKHGISRAAKFVVDESNTLKPGSVYEHAWFTDKAPMYDTMASDLQLFLQFISECAGEYDCEKAKTYANHVVENEKDQPLRGVRIGCRVRQILKKDKTTWNKVEWFHVDQNAVKIKEARAALDKLQGVQAASATSFLSQIT